MLLPAASFAHHSFAAEWDGKNCREFTGVLTKLDWQNPHPYFYVDVKDAAGKVENWSFQAYSPVTLQEKRHRPAGVSRQHRQRSVGQRLSRQEWHAEHRRGWHARSFRMACCARSVSFRIRSRDDESSSSVHVAACATALTLWWRSWHQPARRRPSTPSRSLPPGGPAPRLADGHPDLSGHWFPNGAGQESAAASASIRRRSRRSIPKVTPEERPAFQPWALAKIKRDDADRARTVEVVGELPCRAGFQLSGCRIPTRR